MEKTITSSSTNDRQPTRHCVTKQLKTGALVITTAAALMALTNTASAATTFLGGDISVAANWTASNPPLSAGNPGTVAVDGSIAAGATVSSYFFTQTTGTISQTGGGSNYLLSGGSFKQDGGLWKTGRGFNITAGNVTTLESGTILSSFNGTGGGTSNAEANGADFIINGGLFEVQSGRNLAITNGGTLEVNGGTLTIAGSILDISFKSAGGGISFNGGTTTASGFNFAKDADLTFGGTTSGSVTVASSSGVDSYDWLTGSQMSLTISGSDEWAESEWNAGRLLFNGLGTGDLGTWGDVNGTVFAYDSSTETLSLVPEPSSLALLGLGGLCVLRRRRD